MLVQTAFEERPDLAVAALSLVKQIEVQGMFKLARRHIRTCTRSGSPPPGRLNTTPDAILEAVRLILVTHNGKS